jgi:hypothetical protein
MMQLTFLNLTNGPNLNPAELKLVRGHVTKSNFARRRGLRGKNEQVDSQSRNRRQNNRSYAARVLRGARSLYGPNRAPSWAEACRNQKPRSDSVREPARRDEMTMY